MEAYVLASGSKGNCTYITGNNTNILIDIGITTINVERRLKSLGVEPAKIDAILLTHSHKDHINGLSVFIKKYHPKVYMLSDTFAELPMINKDDCIFFKSQYFSIKNLKITLVKTSHDVPSVGFIIDDERDTLVYITDTGYIRNRDYQLLSNKTYYIFESNHDEKLLLDGPYPHYLKQRILSNKGHLSNKDSSYILSKIVGPNTRSIVLAHLSKENNTLEKAIETLVDILGENNYYIVAAKEHEITGIKEKISV